MTDENKTLQKSSRDPDRTRADLTAWLAGKLPAGSAPEVTELTVPPTGQSSETLFFTATWHESGGSGATSRSARRLVARVAPRPVDIPVFPRYHMEREFRVIRLVEALSGFTGF
jgi:aminoglycoside phosphotransferase (APT) family kinase protein